MTADIFTTPRERALSGTLAVLTHLVFFAMLVFGVTWQKRQPEAMVVDLWTNLPPVAAPRVDPAPEAKPEPPAPKPEPRVEPKPVPKAEPKSVPKPPAKVEPKPVVKPDIALREKKEKERKAAEEALAEKKRREQEQARAQAAMQAKEAAEAKQRAEREQADALKKQAAQQATARDKLKEEYVGRIRAKIRRFIVEPPNLPGNPEVEFDVVLLPGGEVLGVKTRKSSGTAWDNAVERAILKAQPLPLPPDPALFREFRELHLNVKLKE